MNLTGFIGIAVFTGILFLMSEDRKNIRWQFPLILIICEFALAFIFLNTSFGVTAANGVANFFDYLVTAAMNGIEFIFGNVANKGTTVFFLNTLMPIVFISVLVGILLKFGILQFVSNIIGKVVSKISGEDDLISFNAINAFMLSQSGVFVSAKEYIESLTPRQIYSLAICGMSTISSTIIGVYLQMLPPKFVVTGTIMNILMGLFVINIVFPEHDKDENEMNLNFIHNRPQGNILQVISEYATIGFQTVIGISISLMAFLALIKLLNMTCDLFLPWNFQEMLGYVFSPIAWIMGCGKDSVEVGNLIATKLVANEFVSIMNMKNMHLSAHTQTITAVTMMSFANLSSIGNVGGAIYAVSQKQSNIFYKKGLKVLFTAFISSLIIGAIVGIIA